MRCGVGVCVWVLECGCVGEDWRGVGVYGCWRVEVMSGVGGWRACRRWRMRGIRGAMCDRVV